MHLASSYFQYWRGWYSYSRMASHLFSWTCQQNQLQIFSNNQKMVLTPWSWIDLGSLSDLKSYNSIKPIFYGGLNFMEYKSLFIYFSDCKNSLFRIVFLHFTMPTWNSSQSLDIFWPWREGEKMMVLWFGPPYSLPWWTELERVQTCTCCTELRPWWSTPSGISDPRQIISWDWQSERSPLSEQFQCISKLRRCCRCWGDCQPAGRECWDLEDPCSELPSKTHITTSSHHQTEEFQWGLGSGVRTEFETFDSRVEVLRVCEALGLVLVHQAVDHTLVNVVIILQYYLLTKSLRDSPNNNLFNIGQHPPTMTRHTQFWLTDDFFFDN